MQRGRYRCASSTASFLDGYVGRAYILNWHRVRFSRRNLRYSDQIDTRVRPSRCLRRVKDSTVHTKTNQQEYAGVAKLFVEASEEQVQNGYPVASTAGFFSASVRRDVPMRAETLLHMSVACQMRDPCNSA